MFLRFSVMLKETEVIIITETYTLVQQAGRQAHCGGQAG